MLKGFFGLDQEIELAGRVTTIRKEWEGNNSHTMRSYVIKADKPEISRYWVVIYKQPNNSESFEVSKTDFIYLQGKGLQPEFI